MHFFFSLFIYRSTQLASFCQNYGLVFAIGWEFLFGAAKGAALQTDSVSLLPIIADRGGRGQKNGRKRSNWRRGLTCDAYITGHVTRVSQWEATPAGSMQQVQRASSSLSVTTKTSVHPGTAV